MPGAPTLIAIAVGAVVLALVVRALTVRGERAPTRPLPPEIQGAEAVEAYLARGQKIAAIKAYREQHGVGLKEAKEAVERLERERR